MLYPAPLRSGRIAKRVVSVGCCRACYPAVHGCGAAMIDVDGKDLAVWIGPEYESAALKLLVLGESRHDQDFTDREIIEWRIAGKLSGRKRRTFTNFERAVLGQEQLDADVQSFWNRTAFYNYNGSFFPGGPRVDPSHRIRANPQNVGTLRTVLRELKPTHVIVWGFANWNSIDAGSPWTPDKRIPGAQEPYCSTTIDDHTILFTRVRHPSAAFVSRYWAPVLSQFLQLPMEGFTLS